MIEKLGLEGKVSSEFGDNYAQVYEIASFSPQSLEIEYYFNSDLPGDVGDRLDILGVRV